MNTNIKLALSGQIYNMSAVLIDTIGCERTDACWHSLPADAGSIAYLLKDTTDTLEGYLMWHDAQHGLYVAYAKKSARRNGFAMITLCLGHKCIVHAPEFCEGLTYLLQGYMSVNSIGEVDKMHLQNLLNELSEHLMDCISENIFSTNSDAPLAYTIYSDKQQLHDILSNPHQEQYRSYRKLYIIDQANAQSVVSGYQLLRINLRKEYLIKVDSASEFGTVRCDKALVKFGERFTLTYTPKGYAPYTITETAGDNTEYAYLDEISRQVVVKGYDKIKDRIEKYKQFSIEIISSDSHLPIPHGQVYIDGKPYPVENKPLPFKFLDGKDYDIEIAASGYKKAKGKIDARKYSNGDKLKFDLSPALDKIHLTVLYDDVEYSGAVEITSNNRLYQPLMALSNEVLAPRKRKGSGKKPFIYKLLIPIVALVLGGVGFWVGNKLGTDATERKYDAVKKAWVSHDENYLRNNTTWKLADMQSEQYKKVLEELLKGKEVRIQKEFNNTYNEVKTLLDALKEYDASAPEALLKNNNGEINLQQLKTDLPDYITKVKESKDSTYLVTHNIWKKSDLVSNKYKVDFMTGWEHGNVKVAKHTELNANETWKKIRKDIATKKGMDTLIMNHYKRYSECIDLKALDKEIYPNGRGGTGSGRSQGGSPGNSGGNQAGDEVTSQPDSGTLDPDGLL